MAHPPLDSAICTFLSTCVKLETLKNGANPYRLKATSRNFDEANEAAVVYMLNEGGAHFLNEHIPVFKSVKPWKWCIHSL